MAKRILLPILLCIAFLHLSAQPTVISGKVTEKRTGAPIPYANIYFTGTFIGTTSDINGNYRLTTSKPGPVIEVSAVGYKKQTAKVNLHESNSIDFAMEEEVINLNEIEVRPGENPANRLVRNIIRHKKDNNPFMLPSWQSRIYSKMEIDIKNVNSKLRNKRILSQFKFVFNFIDSLEMQGKTFLPVFFNETVSDYYHDEELNKDKEEIVANKASGMKTDMIAQFTGKKYEDINVYDNYITFSDIGFISPVNNLGLDFYKYYLLDSTVTNGIKIYEVSFKPRLPQEAVFDGKFWVADSSFALTKVQMELSGKANVNFVNNLQYSIEFQNTEGRWVPRNESIIADVDVRKDKNSDKLGIIARKTNIYQNFRFGPVATEMAKIKNPISVDKDAVTKDAQYWKSARPIELQPREKNIYLMVDSIKNVRLYRSAAEYIHMFYYGYRDLGNIELGPYYYLYSSNKVEGQRFRLGARTTYKFDHHLRLNGYAAYGTLDHKYKYGGGFEYYFSVKPLSLIAFQAKHDMEMLGKSMYAFSEQNIMTTLLSKNPNTKLNMVDKYELTAQHEWIKGLITKFNITSSKIYSAPFVPLLNQAGVEVPSIKSGELSFGMRYAPGEDIVQDDFERNALANYDPTLTFSVTKGIKGFLGGDFNYLNISAGLSNRVLLNPIGYSLYYLQAGKIWGNVPFPYLKVHEGNETYAFDPYAFNLMNYQEFISDTYASLFWEHHFVGFFLNKIPLLRKLKWREIVGVRTLWGMYDATKHNSLLLPGNMKGLGNQPYTELSAGLENIFKFIRVDGVWRLNYNGQVKHQFGLLVTLQATL